MILNWIHSLIPHLALFAATVGVGLPAIDAGAAGPIIEAGNASGGGDAEVSVDDSSDDSGGEEAQSDGPSPEGKTTSEIKVDWKTVPAEVKAHLQEITKTNPKLGNLLQNAVYTSQTFLREVPGGLKEIRALKSTIEEVGGIEEIKNIRNIHKSLVDEQEDLDNRARSGDPAVLDNLIEIAGEGFPKLMTTAMNKWEATDPQGYQHEMSKLMVAAMKDGGVVSDLNMAFSMLKLNTSEAIKEGVVSLQRVAAWINGVGKAARTAPEKPKVDPNLQAEQQKISDREAQLFNREFTGEFSGWRNGQIKAEVAKISNGRQLTEYQMTTLGQRIVDDIKDILTSDPDYMKDLQRLYDGRNKAELLKFTKTRTQKLLPEATKKAYRALFSGAVKPKKAAPAAQPNATAVAAPVKGWQKIDPSKAPHPDQIDGKKTDFQMKFKKQAILKDGTKVYWGNSVPA